ncbi:hypothetical protein [Massilia sp. DD77]|uniref:hypothetical protein n=1 Tax=Massilia sp. DD77 TaxID=3109349 RepID=UPI002FFDEBC5
MKTVLVVDSTKERDISLDFGLDKRLYLRVAVHTAKAARTAINTVQFDMAILGNVLDVDNPSSFLKELKQAIPKVLAFHETISAAGEAMGHAYIAVTRNS